MQLGYSSLADVSGLQFYKMLGTGAGSGFSIFPNLGQYAMLCVWENDQAAEAFFEHDPYQAEYFVKSSQRDI